MGNRWYMGLHCNRETERWKETPEWNLAVSSEDPWHWTECHLERPGHFWRARHATAVKPWGHFRGKQWSAPKKSWVWVESTPCCWHRRPVKSGPGHLFPLTQRQRTDRLEESNSFANTYFCACKLITPLENQCIVSFQNIKPRENGPLSSCL